MVLEKKKETFYLTVIALAIAGIIIFFQFFANGFDGSVKLQKFNFSVEAGTNPPLGNTSAKIMVIEFTDYQCPFCQKQAMALTPLLKENYVKSGKVVYYIRDNPIKSLHPNAFSAALAARCMGEQGLYWEMHDKLFELRDEWKSLPSSEVGLKFEEYAASLGADAQQFTTCYSSRLYEQDIEKDLEDGYLYGVKGTPTTLIVYYYKPNINELLEIVKSNPHYFELGQDSDGKYVFVIKGALTDKNAAMVLYDKLLNA